LADLQNTGAAAVVPAATAERPSLDTAAVVARSRALGEPEAAAQWRLRAAETLAEVAYPDRVRHLWRYTDPQKLQPQRVLAGEPAGEPVAVELPQNPAVLVRPGQAPLLNAAAEAAGIAVSGLLDDPAACDLVGQAVPADHGWFEALNAAAFDAGVRVRVPRDLVLEQPLRLVIPALPDGDLLPRILVQVEQGAQVTVVEEHRGGTAGSVVVGVTEVLVGANAEVRHVLVQHWEEGVAGHLTQRTLVARDARFLSATAGLGGSLVKADLGGVVTGPGARSELIGVALAEKRQHLDHHTVHRHTSGHAWSNIDFKAAVTDRAHSAYTGLIRIDEGAPVSEAYQENRNLLLSERARVDTIPELEILTDDVSCSHGATATPLDREQIFYLQSRGLTATEAVRVIVRGFVEPTFRLIPAGLREELEELVEARIARLQPEV
jgi:Fe-S cluster assembly protein SufD